MILRSITTKIIVVALAACAMVGVAVGAYLVKLNRDASERRIERLEQVLRDDFDLLAKTQVQTAASMLRRLAALRDRGELTPEQARRLGADLVRELRYGDEGYFWADTTEGVNVVLLGRDTEGKNRLDAVDAHGNAYIRDLRARALEGGGFSDYWFPKKGGGTPLAKRAYSALVEPFGWVIGTGNYVDDIEVALAVERRAARSEAARQLVAILGVVAAALLVAVGMAVFLGRRLSRPIALLTAGVDRMADGDFTIRDELEQLPGATDETGRMTRALLSMRASVREMVRGAQESSEAVAAASKQLESSARAMTRGATEQASALQQTAASMNEIAQTAARVEERAAAVTDATSRSERLASAGEDAISRVRAEIDALGSQVNAIALATAGLAQKALEIDTVAGNVKDLAEQSHVLALNASIEAAQAGASGRGFAVVAAEVRQLSAQSLAASAQVRQLVREIQSASREAIGAAEEGSRRAAGAIGVSRNADDAIAGLAAVVKGATSAAAEIAESIRQQNVGVTQVAEAMNDVSRVLATTADIAREVERASGSLASQSGSLRSAISRYRVSPAEPDR